MGFVWVSKKIHFKYFLSETIINSEADHKDSRLFFFVFKNSRFYNKF